MQANIPVTSTVI